jgi:Fic family protein
MVIEVKNDYIDFKVYPASSVFLAFKSEYGKSIEKIMDENGLDIEALGTIIYLSYKAYCRLVNNPVDTSITKERILDSVTFVELMKVLEKILGTEVKGEKKMKA